MGGWACAHKKKFCKEKVERTQVSRHAQVRNMRKEYIVHIDKGDDEDENEG
jgi:hypothetical protein